MTTLPASIRPPPRTRTVRRAEFAASLRAAAQIGGQWKLFRSNPLSTRNPDRMLVILRDADINNATATSEPNIMMISLYDWPQAAGSSDSKTARVTSSRSGG